MFLKESNVKQWLSRLAAGEVTEQNVPDWLKDFFILHNDEKAMLTVADRTVDTAKIISRFGREGLEFNKQLDNLVSESIQLASAIEEMSATAQEIETLGHQVLERAEKTSQETERGSVALSHLVEKLDSIEASIKSVGGHAEEFVEKTSSIIKLTTTVNEIADQTNLLALNAAIEAARAGEHGRGFSVVADEVRGLAHRSAEAAGEIESIVSGVVSGANNVEKIVRETVDVLNTSHIDRSQLVQTISDARDAAAINVDATVQIASAAAEQSAVSQEMARGVQNTSDGVETSSKLFNTILLNTEKIRELQNESLACFDASSEKMLLRLAKSDHIIWVDKIIRYALFGQNSIQDSELKDHTQCRLGKFLESDKGQRLSIHEKFKMLFEDVHPQVHKAGIEIFKQAKMNGNNQNMQAEVDKLLSLSDNVLTILDEFITDL